MAPVWLKRTAMTWPSDTPTDAPKAPSMRTLEDEQTAHARALQPHRTRGADLVGALDDAHPHGVDHGEEHDHAHDQRDEEEDGAEHPDRLPIERLEVGEVADLEVEVMLGEERREAARGLRARSSVRWSCSDDADGLPFAAAVEELLREREVHDDEVLVELARALRLGARNVQAHDVRRAARGRGRRSRRGASPWLPGAMSVADIDGDIGGRPPAWRASGRQTGRGGQSGM